MEEEDSRGGGPAPCWLPLRVHKHGCMCFTVHASHLVPYARTHYPLGHNRLCHFILDLMDYFLAGKYQQQTNQPNDLAGS